ncbi:hypothetical protein SAMN05216267_1006148 [Actinacidiphila rubida]|uniref:Uncharacterized protein n=2 Tax=Actinacidiphila rubida TaxID=310780 RepID=A0A1H8HBS9_9ACTN|nr:hypothetical protein [Actinacidiphila rubida]SEN53287.1 hypothetical protein SAMN05216267_1006148 [Actinacidiphila rubida]
MDAQAWRAHPQPGPRIAAEWRWPGDAAALWAVVTGVGVLVLAAVLPIETVDNGHAGVQPRHSLLRVHGAAVLLPAAVPLLVALLVAALLYAGRHGGRRWAHAAAWALSTALLAAALVGFVTFLIGVFVLPTGVLLVAATVMAHSARRAAGAR